MSPVLLLCALRWQEGAHLPSTVGALWNQMCRGRAPLVGRHLLPTVSHGTPPVSVTSAWQEAVLGREGRWENNHQAGPPEHGPQNTALYPITGATAATPLHSATTFLFYTVRLRETQLSSFRGCAWLSEGVSQSPLA